ncbi:hypothetical protein HMPREF9089_01185 [Eubacterium brachy ATCC 33089]|nr:hypothetical protein HMPREF9089_01185 [Eubacterium brachy ATCC 33089]
MKKQYNDVKEDVEMPYKKSLKLDIYLISILKQTNRNFISLTNAVMQLKPLI